MGKRKKCRVARPSDPGRERWRTAVFVSTLALGVAAVIALNLAGPARRPAAPNPGPHDHPSGPHGGAVVALGRDNRLHAEAVLGPGGLVRLYTFGRELSEARPVAARVVCAAVRGHAGENEYAVMLRPEPQDGDPPGSASRFSGRVPPAARVGFLRLVVWSLAVDGERFRFEIESPPTAAGSAPAAAAAEAALYSTARGKYRQEDIRANGASPASRKFRGERTAHGHEPADGGRVCPVTRSRADPRFVWVVGGGEYHFCCPPCIDEFVTAAKVRPDEVREPDFYRHR